MTCLPSTPPIYPVIWRILGFVLNAPHLVGKYHEHIIIPGDLTSLQKRTHTHRIHVWYIYVHLVDFFHMLKVNVGKYTTHGSSCDMG